MADTPEADAPPQGRWLPFAGAAQALGVSERTLRRYIAARHFASRRVRHRVQVFVPDEEAARRALLGPPPDALLSALRAALDALERELAAERERAARLADRIAVVEAECRQLAAQAAEPPARVVAAPPEDQLAASAGDQEQKEPGAADGARPHLRGVRRDHPPLL